MCEKTQKSSKLHKISTFWGDFLHLVYVRKLSLRKNLFKTETKLWLLKFLFPISDVEGPHHRHAIVCDEEEADKLRKAKKWQTLQTLEDGFLVGVTRNYYCFVILPDEDNVVYARHRSCPNSPVCRTCASSDFEQSVKSNQCSNCNICGKWRKCLLLKQGEEDPRPKSAEAKAQKKSIGFVTNLDVF